MKKLTTLVLLAFFVLTGMSAQTTAKEQAQTLAERFFKQGQRVQSGTKGVRNVELLRWSVVGTAAMYFPHRRQLLRSTPLSPKWDKAL